MNARYECLCYISARQFSVLWCAADSVDWFQLHKRQFGAITGELIEHPDLFIIACYLYNEWAVEENAGCYLEAIKMIRHRRGFTLAESKWIIDSILGKDIQWAAATVAAALGVKTTMVKYYKLIASIAKSS